jgi:rRNA maturation endonuclease Nob1
MPTQNAKHTQEYISFRSAVRRQVHKLYAASAVDIHAVLKDDPKHAGPDLMDRIEVCLDELVYLNKLVRQGVTYIEPFQKEEGDAREFRIRCRNCSYRARVGFPDNTCPECGATDSMDFNRTPR